MCASHGLIVCLLISESHRKSHSPMTAVDTQIYTGITLILDPTWRITKKLECEHTQSGCTTCDGSALRHKVALENTQHTHARSSESLTAMSSLFFRKSNEWWNKCEVHVWVENLADVSNGQQSWPLSLSNHVVWATSRRYTNPETHMYVHMCMQDDKGKQKPVSRLRGFWHTLARCWRSSLILQRSCVDKDIYALRQLLWIPFKL